VLLRAHRLLLELHEARCLGALKRIIPEGLARVIACDRVSFNEMDATPGRSRIVPDPLPPWWSRFGHIYQIHLFDHPLMDEPAPGRLHEVVDLDSPRYAARWRRSALCHDYFVPLGIRHQLTVRTSRCGSVSTGIGLNRGRRSFSAQERRVFALLAPHLALAWRNASALSARQCDRPGKANPGDENGVLVAVDPERGTMRAVSPRALALLECYFGTDSGGRGKLPDEVWRWLREQQRMLAENDTFVPPAPLAVARNNGRLRIQLVQQHPEECLLTVEFESVSLAPRVPSEATLTPREAEILGWLREGKRNGEIGTILGISGRTVGKHVEHVLEKLGVETRTAAVRAFAERMVLGHG
jgi:DNA-binding CsgD family transcriptional regulator